MPKMVPNGALGGAWGHYPKKAPNFELLARTLANFGSILGIPKCSKNWLKSMLFFGSLFVMILDQIWYQIWTLLGHFFDKI